MSSINNLSVRRIPKSFSAFTLVELLVVITIIGILMGLMLTGVSAVRERARTAQCSSNIRQLGMACIAYSAQHETFPPALVPTTKPTNLYQDLNPQPMYNNQRENWVILILPMFDQVSMYEEIVDLMSNDLTTSISDNNFTPKSGKSPYAKMDELRGREISSFLCPADRNNRTPFVSTEGSWGRINYGANIGLLPVTEMGNMGNWQKSSYCGMMGPRFSVTPEQISDGASNTILLSELRAGLNSNDSRGTWAIGGAGTSATSGNGSIGGQAAGPNNTNPESDSVQNCSAIGVDEKERARLGMPCTGTFNIRATSRSSHKGGINAAFADGSVHWISNEIDINNSVVPNDGSNTVESGDPIFTIWDCLLLSKDGKTFSMEDL